MNAESTHNARGLGTALATLAALGATPDDLVRLVASAPHWRETQTVEDRDFYLARAEAKRARRADRNKRDAIERCVGESFAAFPDAPRGAKRAVDYQARLARAFLAPAEA